MTPADHALIEAAYVGNIDLVRAALASGADPNVRDPRPLIGVNYTPLHSAANLGSSDIAALLLAHGANVNARADWGQTPLILACNAGHLRVAQLLLDSGADSRRRQ